MSSAAIKGSAPAVATTEAAAPREAPKARPPKAALLVLLPGNSLPITADVAQRMAQRGEQVGVKPNTLSGGAKYLHIEKAAKALVRDGELGEAIDGLPNMRLVRVLVEDRRPVDGALIEAFVDPRIYETMPAKQEFYIAVTSSGFRASAEPPSPRYYGPFETELRR
jgi:hypothetical protein